MSMSTLYFQGAFRLGKRRAPTIRFEVKTKSIARVLPETGSIEFTLTSIDGVDSGSKFTFVISNHDIKGMTSSRSCSRHTGLFMCL